MHETSLADLLRLAVRLIEDLGQRDCEFLGLGPGQARVLGAVENLPGSTVGSLGQQLRLDKSTVSVALKTLVAIGYVRRRPDPQDRRCRAFTPTGLGRLLAAEINAIEQDHDEVLRHGLSVEQQQAVRRHLMTMISNLALEVRHPGRRCVTFPDGHPAPGNPSQGHAP